MPAQKNLQIYQGDDWSLLLKIRSRTSEGLLGPYVNLTGYTGKAQVRKTYEQEVPDAEIICEVHPNQVTNPGEVLLSLPAAVTGALSGAYLWDFQLSDPSDKITTYLAGSFLCDRQVTR